MLARLLTLPDRLIAVIFARPWVWRTGVAVVLLAILAIVLARYIHKIGEPDRHGHTTKSAFLRWRPQLEDLDRGADIYQKHNYPNPPIMALVLKPFAALPPVTGAVTWLLLKAALAAVMFLWALGLAVEPGRSFPPLAACLIGALSLHPILGDLQHGNVNIFIAFLVFACLELFRRRFDVTAGVVLALAIACKVTPALFVVYFGWKMLLAWWAAVRARTGWMGVVWESGGKVLLGCVVGLVIWLLVVPSLALGFGRNAELLTNWYGMMVKPFVEQGKVTSEHPNQSIPGVVFRLLTHEPSDTVYDDDGKPVPSEYRNLTDIGPTAAKWVVRACQAAFVLGLVLLAWQRIDGRRQGVWFAAECGFILLGMLLFSERTWKHHATTTAMPMAAAVGCWLYSRSPAGVRAYLIGTLTAATALMTVPSLLPEEPQDLCLTYGTHAAAFVLLTVGMGVVMWVGRIAERKAAT
ncbi:MAG: DUF2029 domain-containing protein [Fimbriiglobus sp.]|jgi:hypothetical protein|nr:DUF2029 domain-containing protein [Fimbriiglobus sp.]